MKTSPLRYWDTDTDMVISDPVLTYEEVTLISQDFSENLLTERENLKAFFSDEIRTLIRVKSIEEMSGIPVKTLVHFLKGRRDLRDDHIAKIIPVLKKLGYQPIDDAWALYDTIP